MLTSKKEAAARAVYDFMTGIEFMPKARALANLLRFFLDVKDSKYYVSKSLVIVMLLKELHVEEKVLCEDFGYASIASGMRRVLSPRADKNEGRGHG